MAGTEQQLQGPQIWVPPTLGGMTQHPAQQRGLGPLLFELVDGENSVHTSPPVQTKASSIQMAHIALRARPIPLQGTEKMLEREADGLASEGAPIRGT